MTNRLSSFPTPPAPPPLARYGGRVAAAALLAISGAGDTYTIDGSGSIAALPPLPDGVKVLLRCAATPTFVSSSNLITPGSKNYGASANDVILAVSCGGGVWIIYPLTTLTAAMIGANGCVYSVKKQVFTSTGTYTPSTGMVYCIIEAIGGGGGGAGCSNGAGNYYCGGGGGAGAYSRSIKTAAQVGSSQTVTIGALGAGGSAGNNSGSAGGTTSVGSLVTAGGGAGGGYANSATWGGSPGAGGAAGTGDVAVTGAPGFGGALFISSIEATYDILLQTFGQGASGPFGSGGYASAANGNVAAGTAAAGYGAGGSSASQQNASSGTAAGGNGSAGLVIVTEFCNQ